MSNNEQEIPPGVRHVLCDDFEIAEKRRVWRSLHHLSRHESNPVLAPDMPWEGYLVMQPGSVIYEREEKIFKMWYNTQPSGDKPEAGHNLCYATSRDGIIWERPKLGLVEHDGKTANNICLTGVNWNHCVLKDEAEGSPEKRYKLLYWGDYKGKKGIHAAFSSDGIRWHCYKNNPVVPRGATGDTFSVMRDPDSGLYWLYHKTPSEPIRTISRMVSSDFIHWREGHKVLAPEENDPPDTQFYGLSAFPYESHYLGLLWVYHTYLQTMDLQLVSSHDGLQWERCCGRKLMMHLEPTNHYPGGAFDSTMVYPASAPVVKDDRFLIYYSGFTVPHNAPAADHDGKIGLATLRRDGFCSLDATAKGYVRTLPIVWQGKHLFLNAVTRSAGSRDAGINAQWKGLFKDCPEGAGEIRVAVEDESGKPFPGLSARECRPFSGDSTSGRVVWEGKEELSALNGKTVRLKFEIRNSKLFSWKMAGENDDE